MVLEKWGLLWNEYKHRHNLIWKVIFQVTAAAVILSVVPYLAPTPIVRHLGRYILIAPGLASLLVVFSTIVMGYELALLGRIRRLHWRLQNDLFETGHPIPQENGRTGLPAVLSTGFDFFVCAYLFILAGLSVANVAICAILWIP
jgi:hypothetical protein